LYLGNKPFANLTLEIKMDRRVDPIFIFACRLPAGHGKNNAIYHLLLATEADLEINNCV